MTDKQYIYKRLFLTLLGLLLSFQLASAAPGDIERVSVNSSVSEGNGSSFYTSISGNGRFVAFMSHASNLVSGDTNNQPDIFVHDRQTRTTSRVSVDSNGNQGNSYSYYTSISDDGRFVAFSSFASNLVSGDTNGTHDTFVHDRQTGTTSRVSVDSNGNQGNNDSYYPSISGDGRFVAFQSDASNLVTGDTNNAPDIFVHDRQTGATSRVSVDSSGNQGNNNGSYYPSISGDGRFVTFASDASNLVTGDTNNQVDIFVHDRQTGTTSLVSVSSGGNQGDRYSSFPSISGNGRFVAFKSTASNLVSGDTNSSDDIFVHDRQTGTTNRVSVDSNGNQGNNSSYSPSISDDGRFIAFGSDASNLVSGDSNNLPDIFVHDRETGTTSHVSADSISIAGSNFNSPSMSSDGHFVAFGSDASNLVSGDTNGQTDVFVKDLQTSTISRVSVSSSGKQGNGDSYYARISGNGRFVAFFSAASNLVSGDTNDAWDIFVHDRQTGTTSRVSVDSSGNEGNNFSSLFSISNDGRFVAFASSASNLVSGDTSFISDIFVHDRQTGVTSRVSVGSSGNEGNGDSYEPSISGDGRFVAFQSYASNLVSGDTNSRQDIFVHDRQTDTTSRVSVGSSGIQGNSDSEHPSISGDGRFVTFQSHASNLVSGDTNGTDDIFVHDLQTGTTSRVSVDSSGGQGNGSNFYPSISGDGRFVTFHSYASNLVSGDTNGIDDIFIHDRQTGATSRVSVDSSGTQGNSSSRFPSISGDGRFVAFHSEASNLVSGDTNGREDIFVHDLQTGTTSRVSMGSGNEGNGGSLYPSISSDGRFVAFASWASNLVSGDSNSAGDIFVAEQAVTDPNAASCDPASGFNVIHGTPGNDKIKGTPDNDIIIGYGGNDRLEGMGGNDCIIGGPGNDQLYGNEGNDILWGGELDNSTVYGSQDRDKLYGNDGDDEMHGGGDKDRLDGNNGDDTMYGDDGDDTMVGHDGDDTMYGGNGRDNMRGDDGDDLMYGEAGDDRLYGRQGDDTLDGGDDNDQLDGSAGTDTCVAGEKLKSCEQ